MGDWYGRGESHNEGDRHEFSRHDFSTICKKHVEDNCQRQLDKKTALDLTTKKNIKDMIFGKIGLTNVDTILEFDLKKDKIAQTIANVAPNFSDYFERLSAKIKKYMVEPRLLKNFNIPANWTNNNVESMIHVLKIIAQWKPMRLPQLVKKIDKEVCGETALLERSLVPDKGDLYYLLMLLM